MDSIMLSKLDPPQESIKKLGKLPRFDIASALAIPFRGLSTAKENKLHRASRTGDCKAISAFFEKDTASCPNDIKLTECQRGKTNSAVNERNHLGATPLWLAAVAGHTEAARLLIENGADLEIEDIKGQTPLYAATKFNHIQCVDLLLKAGANPNGSDTNISTPIYVTARDDYPRVMELLINHGADVNGRHEKISQKAVDYSGSLPIYMTLVYRHFECFQQLVKGGADLCIPSGLNGAGDSTSLVHGILRYACDVKYAELLALCGGINDWEETKELACLYRSRRYGPAKNTEESIKFLEAWKSKPMSLTNISRISIRQRMGQKRLRFVEQMALPKLIKEYVCMSLLEI